MPKVTKAIDELEIFLETDLWHSSQEEWKSEEDAIKYIRRHLNILRKEIDKIQNKTRK